MRKTSLSVGHVCLLFLMFNWVRVEAQDPITAPIDPSIWLNELPTPPDIQSTSVNLEVTEELHNFNPNNGGGADSVHSNKSVIAYAYNQVGATGANRVSYLGPSISWNYGTMVNTTVKNHLTHRITTHWHGAHVATEHDGGPWQRISPDSTWNIAFDILDKSATMWYHPHVMDHTYEQVQMGLSGMIYVEDPPDGVGDDSVLTALHAVLPTRYGVDDFPVILQTKHLKEESGTWVIDSTCCWNNSVLPPPEGASGPGYKPDSNFFYIVNGMAYATDTLPAQVVRLRLLNGDSKYSFYVGLTNGVTGWPTDTLYYIASDAGYTDKSYPRQKVLVNPGGRAEILLDLSGREGETLYLANYAAELPNGIVGRFATADSTKAAFSYRHRPLMKIVVGPQTDLAKVEIPDDLHPQEFSLMDTSDVDHRRTKVFNKYCNPLEIHITDTLVIPSAQSSSCGGFSLDSGQVLVDTTIPWAQNVYLIDDKPMDMGYINDTIMLNDKELWTVHNLSNAAHPFHIHDTHFWVLEIESAGTVTHQPDLPYYFQAPVDNIIILPNTTVKFVGEYKDFGTAIACDSTYMFHCHILPHEDRGMMGQFVVWDTTHVLSPDNHACDMNMIGIEEEIAENGMVLYPNPAWDKLYLGGSSAEASRIRIIDLQGRVLSEQRLAPFEGKTEVSIRNLDRGLIFVEWRSGKEIHVRKILIQK